jgi:hypothetical protein
MAAVHIGLLLPLAFAGAPACARWLLFAAEEPLLRLARTMHVHARS